MSTTTISTRESKGGRRTMSKIWEDYQTIRISGIWTYHMVCAWTGHCPHCPTKHRTQSYNSCLGGKQIGNYYLLHVSLRLEKTSSALLQLSNSQHFSEANFHPCWQLKKGRPAAAAASSQLQLLVMLTTKKKQHPLSCNSVTFSKWKSHTHSHTVPFWIGRQENSAGPEPKAVMRQLS